MVAANLPIRVEDRACGRSFCKPARETAGDWAGRWLSQALHHRRRVGLFEPAEAVSGAYDRRRDGTGRAPRAPSLSQGGTMRPPRADGRGLRASVRSGSIATEEG